MFIVDEIPRKISVLFSTPFPLPTPIVAPNVLNRLIFSVQVSVAQLSTNSLILRGVGGTLARESVLRSVGILLLRVQAPPSVPWPDEGPESLRSPCCGLAIFNDRQPTCQRLACLMFSENMASSLTFFTFSIGVVVVHWVAPPILSSSGSTLAQYPSNHHPAPTKLLTSLSLSITTAADLAQDDAGSALCQDERNFRCDLHGSQCVLANATCDGIAHCANGRDESVERCGTCGGGQPSPTPYQDISYLRGK
ncbi:G-protein coupled receptor grl101 [Plakobranchus ocellatus]|uniref:G-protein coupled receptor grl101 n=1 Tax=Plakobranchus ocellatus TaxID=259542 RepID=A0AAV4AJ01_9GAST|nr:G-protein coupled receptor grl101 [Plakobranchus ocellatus]